MLTPAQYKALRKLEDNPLATIPEAVEFWLWLQMYIYWQEPDGWWLSHTASAAMYTYEYARKAKTLPDYLCRLQKALDKADGDTVAVSTLDLQRLIEDVRHNTYRSKSR